LNFHDVFIAFFTKKHFESGYTALLHVQAVYHQSSSNICLIVARRTKLFSWKILTNLWISNLKN